MISVDMVVKCIDCIEVSSEHDEIEGYRDAVNCFPGYQQEIALKLVNTNIDKYASLLSLLTDDMLTGLWRRCDSREYILRYCYDRTVISEAVMRDGSADELVSLFYKTQSDVLHNTLFYKILDMCKYDDHIMKQVLRNATKTQLFDAWASRTWGDEHVAWFVNDYYAVPAALVRHLTSQAAALKDGYALARYSNDPAVLEILAKSPAGSVRGNVALNEHCPKRTLSELSKDINPTVVKFANEALDRLWRSECSST